MSPANQAPPARRLFLIEIWNENREAFKAILTDTFWCLIGLGVLFLVFEELALSSAGDVVLHAKEENA